MIYNGRVWQLSSPPVFKSKWKLWKFLGVGDISLNIAGFSDKQKVILLECVPLLLTNWPIMSDKSMWPLVDQTAFVTICDNLITSMWPRIHTQPQKSWTLTLKTFITTKLKNTKNIYYSKVENNLNYSFLSVPLGDQAAWGNYSMQAVWIQAVRVLETIV